MKLYIEILIIALLLSFTHPFKADCLVGGYTLDVNALSKVIPHPTEIDTVFAIQTPVEPDSLVLLKSCDSGSTWSATALIREFYIITDLAISPIDPEFMVVTTERGTLVSDNGGINWAETGLPGHKLEFSYDGTLYIHGDKKIYKYLSSQSEPELLSTLPQNFNVLRINPVDSSQMHVGQYYSTDGGINWQKIFGDEKLDVKYSLSDPMQMIVTENPLLLSYDGGINWNEMQLEEFEFFNQYHPQGRIVAFDLQDSNKVWLVAGNCGLFQSDNSGARWTIKDNGISGTSENCNLGSNYAYIKDFKISPAAPNRLYAITSDGLFTSSNNGLNWNQANGLASENPDPPPPNPFSGNADLSLEVSDLPGNYTPPVTFHFTGKIRNHGPDTAREITLSIAADIISTSHGTCIENNCDFGDLASGSTISLEFERDLLSGGHGANCTGDIFTISGRVDATTHDPVDSNNSISISSTRNNNVSLASYCTGEGILQNNDTGGGASEQWLIMTLLLTLYRRLKNTLTN